MLGFTRQVQIEDGPHRFEILACTAEASRELTDALADRVRQLYLDEAALRKLLEHQAKELHEVADSALLAEAVARVAKAAIPEPGTHEVAQLDTARNEAAEVIALEALETHHAAVVPAPRIRHKEVPTAPARGLDALGLRSAPLTVLVTEVKASSDTDSPPGVVGTGEHSLRNQYDRFLGDKDADRMLVEINRCLKQAPEHGPLLAEAALLHVKDALPTVVAPVLVRPRDCATHADFGCFKDEPDRYQPATTHFCVVCIDSDLDDLAQQVYDKARK